MAAELVTPVDELTGLPLPILPIEPQHMAPFVRENFHHHFHPRASSELQGCGGMAVRCVRGQRLPMGLHKRYHDLYSGPLLPDNDQDRFKICVLACAGYVARRAIDLTAHQEPQEVDLTEQDFDRYEIASRVCMERANKPGQVWVVRNTIGRFFAEHALKQDIEHISDRVIDEFLHTACAQRAKELGNFMLAEAVEVAIDPVMPVYSIASRRNLINPRFARRATTVVRSFFGKDFYPAYYTQLRQKFAA